MRRKLLLPALAACTLLAVSAPLATAKPHKAHAASLRSSLNKLAASIGQLKSEVTNIKGVNSGQTGAINGVDKRVDTVVGNLAAIKATVDAIVTVATTQIQPGLIALKDGLTAAGAGLVSINAALTNTTTGLVGLNLARPQFGVFSSAGAIQGGTGQVTGGSGPKTNALAAVGGNYVIDFGNNVSSRMYSVNTFPGGDAAGIGHAVNCASPGVAANCGALQAVASDASPNHVLIQFGAGGGTAPANGFSITAISG